MKSVSSILLHFIFLLSFKTSFSQENKVVHMVMFKLKENITHEQKLKAENALDKMLNEIKEIQFFEWGKNFSDRAIAYDYGLYVSFRSKEDLNAYTLHPLHKEAAALWKEISDWHIVDYTTTLVEKNKSKPEDPK